MSKRGRHRRPVRWRRAILPTAAVAAAAAVVATFPGAAASARTLPAAEPGQPGDQLVPVLAHSFAHPASPAASAVYTIQAGDTLSKLAGQYCGSPVKYPDLAANNRIANADLIITGKHLKLACHAAADVLAAWHRSQRHAYRLTAAVARSGDPNDGHGGAYGHPYFCGDGDGDGYDITCSELHHGHAYGVSSTGSVRHAYARVQSGGYSVSSSFQRCVISRESGGNTQVMNSSGHYGLYQFSASTWAAYGGSPALFGHASGAYQTQIFNNAIRAGGQSNWSPYDGC